MAVASSSRYQQVEDGEWIRPTTEGWKMACCDCGLVHTVNFRIVTQGRRRLIALQPTRDARATAAKRRSKKYPCVKAPE